MRTRAPRQRAGNTTSPYVPTLTFEERLRAAEAARQAQVRLYELRDAAEEARRAAELLQEKRERWEGQRRERD